MRRFIPYIASIMILILAVPAGRAVSQELVQVVSQKISKSIDWSLGMSVMLNAENAEIYCTSHQANNIDIDLTIISKHEDRNRAEEDLKKMKWLSEVKGNTLYLRNYIELGRYESKPASALKVIYNIRLPENCPVEIRNYFGKIEVKNLKANLKISSKFTKIDLAEIEGVTTVNTTFGDVTASRIRGETAIISNRSDITISGVGGKLDLNSTIAKINLSDLNTITEIHIEAQKSFLDLKITGLNRFAYKFDLHNCEFEKPKNMVPVFTKNEKEEINASYNTAQEYPLIELNVNIGSLTIEQQ